VERLPGRVNRLLGALVNQELKVKVEMIDDGAMIERLQKVANRITLGLLIAAMIVGAAMLMRVEISFRILGYPVSRCSSSCWRRAATHGSAPRSSGTIGRSTRDGDVSLSPRASA